MKLEFLTYYTDRDGETIAIWNSLENVITKEGKTFLIHSILKPNRRRHGGMHGRPLVIERPNQPGGRAVRILPKVGRLFCRIPLSCTPPPDCQELAQRAGALPKTEKNTTPEN